MHRRLKLLGIVSGMLVVLPTVGIAGGDPGSLPNPGQVAPPPVSKGSTRNVNAEVYQTLGQYHRQGSRTNSGYAYGTRYPRQVNPGQMATQTPVYQNPGTQSPVAQTPYGGTKGSGMYYRPNPGQSPGGYYGKNPGWTQPEPQPDNARLGRTLGGAAGLAAGAMGGAALSAAVIKAAGLAALPPVAKILVGSAITAGGAFLGAKALSHIGQSGDRALGSKTTWTIAGAVAGSVLGLTFMPVLGPLSPMVSRIVGGVLGGVVGGSLAGMLSPHLENHVTPPAIYGTAGAVLGGLGFGVAGAAAGAAGGYALGHVMDKGFFADRDTTLGDIRDDVRHDIRDGLHDVRDRFRHYADTVDDWYHDRTDRFQERVHGHGDYYDYNSYYYSDYEGSRQTFAGYGQGMVKGGHSYGNDAISVSFEWNGEAPQDLREARDNYHRALEYFQRVSRSGSAADQNRAARIVHRTQREYVRMKGEY